MTELCCDRCGWHLGWITDGIAPRSFVHCDDCKERDSEEEDEEFGRQALRSSDGGKDA